MVAFIVGNSHPDLPVEPIPSSSPVHATNNVWALRFCRDGDSHCNLDESHFVWPETSSLIPGGGNGEDLRLCKDRIPDAENQAEFQERGISGRNDLLPGLPHDLAVSCLARVHLAYHHILRCVSRCWRQVFSSHPLYRLRGGEGWREEAMVVVRGDPHLNGAWLYIPLPLPSWKPPGVNETSRYQQQQKQQQQQQQQEGEDKSGSRATTGSLNASGGHTGSLNASRGPTGSDSDNSITISNSSNNTSSGSSSSCSIRSGEGRSSTPKHSGVWQRLPAAPSSSLSTYGRSHFAVVSHGCSIMLLGGMQFDAAAYPPDVPHPTASVLSFCLVTRRWRQLSPMNVPRGSPACTSLPSHFRSNSPSLNHQHNSAADGPSLSPNYAGSNRDAYMGSSREDCRDNLCSCSEASGSRVRGGNCLCSRHGPPATSRVDGHHTHHDGKSVKSKECDGDCCSRNSNATGSSLSGRRTVRAASVVVAGGIRHDSAVGGSDVFLAACEAYDAASDSWHVLPPLTQPRGGGVAALLPGMSTESMAERCIPGGALIGQAMSAGSSEVNSVGRSYASGAGSDHSGKASTVVVMGGYGSARDEGNDRWRRARFRGDAEGEGDQQQQLEQLEQHEVQRRLEEGVAAVDHTGDGEQHEQRRGRRVQLRQQQQQMEQAVRTGLPVQGLDFADVLTANSSGTSTVGGSQWERSTAMWLPGERQAAGPIAVVHNRAYTQAAVNNKRIVAINSTGAATGAAAGAADAAGADCGAFAAAALGHAPVHAAAVAADGGAVHGHAPTSESTAYMLSGNAILRFDPLSCKWLRETNVARADSQASFFALNGELYVVPPSPPTTVRRTPPVQHVYSLATGTWRTVPLQRRLRGIRSDGRAGNSCAAAVVML